MFATLLSRLRSPRQTKTGSFGTLHIDTDPVLGEPFAVRIVFPLAVTPDAPSALALELTEIVIDASGSTTSTQVGHCATFIAIASTGLREITYAATLVAPPNRHATAYVKGGVSYEWQLQLGSNQWVRGCHWPVLINRARNAGHDVAATVAITANVAASEAAFSARYRELRAHDATTITALIAPQDCAITHVGRQWQARFAARGFHAASRALAGIAVAFLTWAFYPLVFAQPDIDSDTLIAAFFRAIMAVLFAALAAHVVMRRYHVTISPEGLVATLASPFNQHSMIVPLATLSHFGCEVAMVENAIGKTRHYSRIRAMQRHLDTAHIVSPMLSTPGTIAALVIEMNDALADVQHYGVTPAPEVAAYVFTDRQRFTAKATVVALLLLLWLAAFILFIHVRNSL